MAIFNSYGNWYPQVMQSDSRWSTDKKTAGGLLPSSSMGRMTSQIWWKVIKLYKIHVPNHQPAKYDCQNSSEHLLELPSNSEVFQVLLGNDIVLTALGVTGCEFPRVQLAMVRTCEKVERSRKKHNMLVVVMHGILPRKNVDDRRCNKNWDVPT